ncbi:MAG: multiheme c-type cytochrome, partial [Rhodothermales bacterium]|nr:multiheme c-type cytochrome [Rhodothermales bacterium]
MSALRLSPFLLAVCLAAASLFSGCGAGEPERDGVPAAVAAAEVGEAAGYAGDEACQSCHADLYASYHETPMGRSVTRSAPPRAPAGFPAAGRGPAVYSDELDLYYQAYVRGDTLYQREFRLDAASAVTYERVEHADYVIGSGHNTRSYLMHEDGYVTEMPLTWYVERALWDLSPGYDVGNPRFSRPTNLECVTCHNGLPEHTPFTQNHFAELEVGITCERCHGPAAAHVAARERGEAPAEGPPDPFVVDPADLSREQQLAVCQQCHLEGVTVFEPGEDPTTFRPGELLGAHRTVFVRADQLDDPEQFGVASHDFRLAQSACYQQSEMTCTTCHDPHRSVEALRAELGED